MHCIVHCLISGEDELAPLMQRITDAGIPEEDVFVVWRNARAMSTSLAGMKQLGDAGWKALGGLFLPAAWWWGMATGAWPVEQPKVSSNEKAAVTCINRRLVGVQRETGPK